MQFIEKNFPCPPFVLYLSFFSSYMYSPPQQKKAPSALQKKMCYATVPSAGKHGSAVRRRLLALQASLIAAATARQAPRTGVTRDQRAGSMIKRCLCSPTKHPGSFRCRHHIAEYAWGARFVGKK